jgi:hypothetical protein
MVTTGCSAGFSLPVRLVLLVCAAVALPELALRFLETADSSAPATGTVRAVCAPVFARYLPLRALALAHPLLVAPAAAVVAAAVFMLGRAATRLWFNEIRPRLAGTHFEQEPLRFPSAEPDLLELVTRRPPGKTVVGVAPPNRFFGSWQPVYLSERQRSAHRHVLGKTGSGKTQSVLLPEVLQDVLDGKGVVLVDGKGSDENIQSILAIAALAQRHRDVRVFSLPAWNQPQLFSHRYNLVHVAPRGPGPDNGGGDPAIVAERVFSVLPLGDNQFYNTQAKLILTNLCRLLHGIVDDDWRGIPFTLRDISVCLKGVGSLAGREDDLSEKPAKPGNENGPGEKLPRPGRDGWGEALRWCLETSKDEVAHREIESQVRRLGRRVHETFSGLVGAVDSFDSPLVNAYDPDIVFEEVLQKNLIAYVQLPANLFKIQARAIGRAILADVEQQGAMRQVFRSERNQKPFAVKVDEFGRFADQQFVDSLSQLRDAHLQFTIAHQSLADLEIVSREFASAVWDNTRTKDVLSQDNPALCEMLAKSIGTEQVVEHTVRREPGPLWTSIETQNSSTKLVEAYRLHPNRIKHLARCGQGYLYTDEGVTPVCYPMFPTSLRARYPLAVNDQEGARGLRLYERFVADRTGQTGALDRVVGGAL